MGAPTDRLTVAVFAAVLLFASGTASADPGSSAPSPAHFRIEDLSLRLSLLFQEGAGYQSQAGAGGGAGSEELVVLSPVLSASLRQGERFTHRLTVPVDIVSSASADALDAVTRASRVNEAADFELMSSFRVGDDDVVDAMIGFHVEEPYRSPYAAIGYTRELADDNATLSVRANYVADVFDPLTPQGDDLGSTTRHTLNGNASASQVLSPTTLGVITYGATLQVGTLETTWNSTPVVGSDARRAERLPAHRVRHAVSGLLAQHVPATRGTLRASYRFYIDDIGIRAHTIQGELYQWLGPRVLARFGYRYHTQTGADFYVTEVAPDHPEDAPVTSDSDLAPLDAHEWGAKLVVYVNPPGSGRAADHVDVSYLRYTRSNDLTIDVVALSYARQF